MRANNLETALSRDRNIHVASLAPPDMFFSCTCIYMYCTNSFHVMCVLWNQDASLSDLSGHLTIRLIRTPRSGLSLIKSRSGHFTNQDTPHYHDISLIEISLIEISLIFIAPSLLYAMHSHCYVIAIFQFLCVNTCAAKQCTCVCVQLLPQTVLYTEWDYGGVCVSGNEPVKYASFQYSYSIKFHLSTPKIRTPHYSGHFINQDTSLIRTLTNQDTSLFRTLY